MWANIFMWKPAMADPCLVSWQWACSQPKWECFSVSCIHTEKHSVYISHTIDIHTCVCVSVCMCLLNLKHQWFCMSNLRILLNVALCQSSHANLVKGYQLGPHLPRRFHVHQETTAKLWHCCHSLVTESWRVSFCSTLPPVTEPPPGCWHS